jgi:hypothetical protein
MERGFLVSRITEDKASVRAYNGNSATQILPRPVHAGERIGDRSGARSVLHDEAKSFPREIEQSTMHPND